MLSLTLLFVLVFFFFVFFFSPFSTVITSLGQEKRKLVYLLLVHLFVYFTRVDFCPSLPLDVGGLLRLVIVVLHGLFY